MCGFETQPDCPETQSSASIIVICSSRMVSVSGRDACVFLLGLASCCHLPMPAEKVFPFLSSCYYYALERKFGKLFQKKAERRYYFKAGTAAGTGKGSRKIMRVIQTAGKVAKRNSFRYTSNCLSLHFAKKYKISADK